MSNTDDMAEILVQGTLKGFEPEKPQVVEVPPVQAGPGYGARLKAESGSELTAEYKAREALRGANQNSDVKPNVAYPGWARPKTQRGWLSVRAGIQETINKDKK